MEGEDGEEEQEEDEGAEEEEVPLTPPCCSLWGLPLSNGLRSHPETCHGKGGSKPFVDLHMWLPHNPG